MKARPNSFERAESSESRDPEGMKQKERKDNTLDKTLVTSWKRLLPSWFGKDSGEDEKSSEKSTKTKTLSVNN